MDGTDTQRAIRLVAALLRNPRNLPRYLRTLPIMQATPMDLKLPWTSFGAIDFLNHFLSKDMIIFEWGSGGSTIFFAQRARRVVAVESDTSWQKRVDERLSHSGLKNVEILLRPLNEGAYVDAIDGYEPDVVLVDGREAEGAMRSDCFRRAENEIQPGSAIILDDAWRYPELHRTSRAKEVLIFQGPGPCRYGVTSTSVFLY